MGSRIIYYSFAFGTLGINKVIKMRCSLIFFHRREHLEAQRNSTDKSERSSKNSSFEAKTQSTSSTMIEAKTVMTATSLIVNGKASVVTTTTELKTTTVSINTSPVMSTMSTLTVDTKAIEKSSLDASVNPPTIVMSSVTPPAISPTAGSSLPLPGTSTSGSSSPVGSPNVNNAPMHPLLSTRRDSTTQVAVIDKVFFNVTKDIN